MRKASRPKPSRRAARKVLPAKFFDRPTLTVARGLLGKYIVRRLPSSRKDGRARTIALMITETEAYVGPHDHASHASRGRTLRNAPMFGPPGVFYIYFTYGMHWMANIVTEREGYPAAVLIRAGAACENGHDPKAGGAPIHVNGPARLTKFLRITGAQNEIPATPKDRLWFEDRGTRIPRSKIVAGKRIGVEYAGPEWAGRPYRFSLYKM